MEKRSLLNALTVADVWELVVEKPSTIGPEAPLVELLEKAVEDKRTRHVYVVDGERRLLGTVRMTTVTELLFPLPALDAVMSEPYLFHRINLGSQTVGEFMNKNPRTVQTDTGLQDLARILIEERITELPVIDESKVLIGQVNMYEVIQAYLQVRQE